MYYEMINGHDFMNLTIKFLISGDLSCKSQCNEILRTYTYKHKAEKTAKTISLIQMEIKLATQRHT